MTMVPSGSSSASAGALVLLGPLTGSGDHRTHFRVQPRLLIDHFQLVYFALLRVTLHHAGERAAK